MRPSILEGRFPSIEPAWKKAWLADNKVKLDSYVQSMYIVNMPTIFVIGPFRIIINTKDHRPAHVHCVGPGVSVIIAILDQEVIRNNGVSPKDTKRLKEFIKVQSEVLMNEWRHYHEEE
ncbi:MAG: DUF4160 domain-containing protein [Proteobacteria bacterium]|nr:DUF4160 domain-containing protein [Pseudomonadota bacterium]